MKDFELSWEEFKGDRLFPERVRHADNLFKQVCLRCASRRQKAVGVGYAGIRLPLFSSYQVSSIGNLSRRVGIENLLEQVSPFSLRQPAQPENTNGGELDE